MSQVEVDRIVDYAKKRTKEIGKNAKIFVLGTDITIPEDCIDTQSKKLDRKVKDSIEKELIEGDLINVDWKICPCDNSVLINNLKQFCQEKGVDIQVPAPRCFYVMTLGSVSEQEIKEYVNECNNKERSDSTNMALSMLSMFLHAMASGENTSEQPTMPIVAPLTMPKEKSQESQASQDVQPGPGGES